MQEASSARLGVGELIRRKRVQRGMTHQSLANAAGRSRGYIWKVENGALMPNVRCFASMAAAMDMSADEILLVIRAEALIDAESRMTVIPATYDPSSPEQV